MGLARAGRCRRTPLHLYEEARPPTGLLFLAGDATSKSADATTPVAGIPPKLKKCHPEGWRYEKALRVSWENRLCGAETFGLAQRISMQDRFQCLIKRR